MTGSIRPYELTFESRPEYLYAHIKALRVDRDTAVSYLTEVADACAKASTKRVLIYREIPSVPDTPTMFYLATYLLKVMPDVRTAFVNPFPSNTGTLKFAVKMGSNAGGMHELFDNVEDAEQWLKEDPKQVKA